MLARIYADELFQNTSPITLPKAPLKHYPAMAGEAGGLVEQTVEVVKDWLVCAAPRPVSECAQMDDTDMYTSSDVDQAVTAVAVLDASRYPEDSACLLKNDLQSAQTTGGKRPAPPADAAAAGSKKPRVPAVGGGAAGSAPSYAAASAGDLGASVARLGPEYAS